MYSAEYNLITVAVHYCRTAMIYRLVQSYGLDTNLRDWKGWTPLSYAVQFPKQYPCLMALLELGADPNVLDYQGM